MKRYNVSVSVVIGVRYAIIFCITAFLYNLFGERMVNMLYFCEKIVF